MSDFDLRKSKEIIMKARGYEKYGLSEMKKDEALLFLETAIENGSEVKEAIADMRMIDSLMEMKRLHFVVFGNIKRTKDGYLRKGSDLNNSLNAIIDGRLRNAF